MSANTTTRTTVEVSCIALAPGDPAVLLAAGDIGVCGATAPFQTAGIVARYPSATVAAVGDLAYPDGREHDFRDCYHPSWGKHKARTRPALGNHEYNNTGSAQAYFKYFGPVAGDPSKGYYSYTLGEWFVVVLNVNSFRLSRVSVKSGSEQERWLRQELSSNSSRCTLAYFHYPRFSSGHHGSRNFVQDIWDTLYDYDVDVVVVAHEHSYERFAKMDKSGAADPVRGIRQFVVGTGGVKLRSFNTPLPTSEVRNSDTHGVLKLTLEADAYQWEFLPVEGKTFTDTGRTTCH
ncbi:MAG: metallophosphoesterase [Gemmatimonadetes bacterium]|nr:metallophosphoesterase [Gemmatimonadota bacterium]